VTASPLEGRSGGDRGGSIYDLGYRGYEGPRLGRRAAVTALLTHTLRTAYGLGRNTRSKVMPVGLVVFAILPALLGVGFIVLFSQLGPAGEAMEAMEAFSPFRYSTLFPFTYILVFLFSASQAPELFGRDQLSGVLPLYFSRAISRLDYAMARLLGLYVALLVLVFAPQIILFIGRILVASDLATGLSEELPELPATLAVGLISTTLVGSLSAAIAALTPRRSYATVAIIAVFLIPSAFAGFLVTNDVGLLGQAAVLLSPGGVLEGVNAFLFSVPPEDEIVRLADIEGWVYLAAAAAWIIGSLALLASRYKRMAL